MVSGGLEGGNLPYRMQVDEAQKPILITIDTGNNY